MNRVVFACTLAADTLALAWSPSMRSACRRLYTPPLPVARCSSSSCRNHEKLRQATVSIQHAGRARQWPAALNVLRKLCADGLEPDAVVFNATLAACDRGSQWLQAFKVLEAMQCGAVLPDIVSINTTIGTCERNSVWTWGLVLLHGMGETYALLPDVVTFNSLITSHAKRAQWGRALLFFSEMRSAGVRPNAITYCSILRFCATAPGGPRVFAILEHMRLESATPSRAAYAAAMQSCRSAGNWEEALALLAEMKIDFLQPDCVAFAAAMTAVSRSSQWAIAVALFCDMSEAGIACDAVAYNATMAALSRGRRWAEVLWHLKQMTCSSLGSSVMATTTAIGACKGQHQWELALQLFVHMSHERLFPDATAFSTVASVLGQAQQWVRVLLLWEELRARRFNLNHRAVGDVIFCLASGGRWEAALTIWSSMREGADVANGVRDDTSEGHVRSAAIAVFRRTLQWEAALAFSTRHVLAALERGDAEGMKTALRTVNAGIAACGEASQWEQALAQLPHMQSLQLCPNNVTYNSLISACTGVAGHSDRAMELLAQARQSGSASVEAFTSAMSACALDSGWAQAVHLLSELFSSPHQKDALAYNAAIGACEAGRAWQECLRLLDDARGQALFPDGVGYRAAVRACGHGRNWRAALAAVQDMRETSVADPGGSVWSALAWSLEVSGAPPLPLLPGRLDADCKEALCLGFVKLHARFGDLGAVIHAIECFAHEHAWIKVAGGEKARLLEGCLQPGDRVLELGTYVGYSALRLCRRLRLLGAGGYVISCESDDAVAHVARSVIAWAGASEEVDVRIGRASDWISTEELTDIDVLVLDHRGTLYHDDLQRARPFLAPGARVWADNVLHPGAPLFLAAAVADFALVVHDVDEFLHQPPLRDWVVLGALPKHIRWCEARAPPDWRCERSLQRWSAEVEILCKDSAAGHSVDWWGFQARIGVALRAWCRRADAGQCEGGRDRAGPAAIAFAAAKE